MLPEHGMEMQMPDTILETDSTKPMLSEWMTRAELAEELKITTETLCRWNSRRQGPAPTRVGRKVLYRRDTVRAWLLAQEQERTAIGQRADLRTRGRR